MPPRVLALNIQLPDGVSVPRGSPLLVELRDTSLEDAAAITLKQVTSRVERAGDEALKVTIDHGSVPEGTTAWVHLDVDGDGRVSKGDYITMESYPIATGGDQEMSIRLKRV